MAKYNVKFKDLQNQVASFQSIGEKLASCESKLSSIANAMDTRDDSMATLSSQLRSINNAIPPIKNKLSSAGTTTVMISIQ